MGRHSTPIKKRLSDQLPIHTPDQGLWQRISSGLDILDADKAIQQKLEHLPVHSPDKGTWMIIYTQLNRIAYYKSVARIAVAVAACLLLFFGVLQFSDNKSSTRKNVPLATLGHKDQNSIEINNQVVMFNYPATESIQKQEKSTIQTSLLSNSTKKAVEVLPEEFMAANMTNIEREVVQSPNPITSVEIQEISMAKSTSPTIRSHSEKYLNTPDNIINHSFTVGDVQKGQKPNKSLKYYTPKEPIPDKTKNNFALAMDYFPESIYNGTENTMFRNFDITALYNKEKVRFSTSVGMAYTEVDMQFDMNYNINIPITAHGSGGRLDTIGYNVSKVQSQYRGTETHRYFTYNFGFGRRLFSLGKFSTWIDAGAGFGVRLNNPDLVSTTESSIKGQYNVVFTSVKPSKPVYNDFNVNFVTGIDFNYKIMNRISFSFTPTSRWFFKSIMTKDNQPTDELTLGFKTGMKFDF